MGKLKRSKKIDERPSSDSLLTVNTIIEETRKTSTLCTCYVENYSNLEQHKEYKTYHEIYSHWWEVYYRKRHNLLFVHLNTDVFNADAVLSLLKSDGETMGSIHSEELEGGMHFALFEEKVIYNPENLLLINGAITLQSKYTARPLEYNIVVTPGLQKTSDESIHNSDVIGLCNDLKHLYLNSSFSNFIIVAGDIAFKVHSLIITLRSDYFAELFRNAPFIVSHYIEIDASPEILHDVLLFIYSGELRDMEFTDMIQIFYIACNWQIMGLVQICIDYFKANFAADNILEILCRACQYNVPELVHGVLRFIENLPKSLMETEEWTEIILEASRIYYCSRNL